jgi:hypothetical protein
MNPSNTSTLITIETEISEISYEKAQQWLSQHPTYSINDLISMSLNKFFREKEAWKKAI